MRKSVTILMIAFFLAIAFSGCDVDSSQTPAPSPVSTSTSSVAPSPVIDQDEAIAIAYSNVPPLVAERASLSVRWTPQIAPHGAWQMEFEDPGITQEELEWVNNPSGTPEVRLNDIISTGIYKILLINIDGQTGEVMLKMASSANIRTYTLPPPLTVIPPKTPEVNNNYRSDANYLSVNLPDGWAAAEGPEYVVSTGHLLGMVAFNSWGEEGFWSRYEAHGTSQTYGPSTVMNSLPTGGAYIVLIQIVMPPPIGSEQEDYLPNDFSGLLTPDNWQINVGFNSIFGFSKWGDYYELQVACDPAATGKTVEELRSVLESWRFDETPAGNVGWALPLARELIPDKAQPFPRYTGYFGSGENDGVVRSIEAEVDEDKAVHFRFTYYWDVPSLGLSRDNLASSPKHWWEVDVLSDGKAILTDEGGDPLPFN